MGLVGVNTVTITSALNSLHTGSLNIGLGAVISVHEKPINRLFGRTCHAVTIYARKVPQTYVITRFVTTNERTKKQLLSHAL